MAESETASASSPSAPSRVTSAVVLGLVLVAAAALRLTSLDWDDSHHLHPDERFLTMVANDVRLPATFGAYLDTARSSINPTNVGQSYFTYGTLPLFLTRLVAEQVGLASYDRIQLVGRALSSLFDLGSVLLVYFIAWRLAGFRAAMVAALLLSFSVINIQQAHYFTVDSAATFFTTLALWALITATLDGTFYRHALFGLSLGLALACRINLMLLIGLYPIALLLMWRLRVMTLPRLALAAALALGVAGAVFRVAQPYAFAGPHLLSLRLAPEFVQSMTTIGGFSLGVADFPPSVQWVGRLPIVFPGRNLLVWGLGPAWGAAALAALVSLVARWRGSANDRGRAAGLIVAAWIILLFVFHATQFVATLRYFLPIVPMLAVATGVFLSGRSWRGRAPVLLLVVVLIVTAGWAIAFTSIYRRPITRVEASRWIYDHVGANSTIAAEHWDDALPLSIENRTTGEYQNLQLKLYDDESAAKRQELIDVLDRADIIVLSSNRLYRSIPREPWRYPIARRYYELLFSGALGFKLEKVFTSYPRIGAVEIVDDDAEEAFTVYDHPKVLIFRKTAAYASAQTAALLSEVPLAGIVRVPPREASALYRRTRPSELVTPDESAVRQPVASARMDSLEAVLRWLVAFEVLSLALFCLLNPVLGWTVDHGYGLARVFAWLTPGTAVWILAAAGVLPSDAASARAVVGLIVAAGAWAGWRRRHSISAALRSGTLSTQIATVEAVWLLVVLAFLAVKAFSPAIYWGEKPMDFAILNALLRTPTVPPADPWFAGETLNYFYFGHALTAVFTMLTGVPAAMAFNLAVPTLAGLLAVSTFLVIQQVTGRRLPAVCGAIAMVAVGNMAGLRMLLEGTARASFDYFWATSRLIQARSTSIRPGT